MLLQRIEKKQVDIGIGLTVLDIGNDDRADRGAEGALEVFKDMIEMLFSSYVMSNSLRPHALQ